LDAAHWQSCADRSRGLAAAAAALADRQIDVCLEIGPASLTESDRRLLAQDRPVGCVVPSLLPADGGGVDVLTAVATLYAVGADVLWERLAPANGHCVRVPTYPWQRQRLWAPGKNRLAESPSRLPAGEGVSQPPSPAAEPEAPARVCRRPDLTVPYVAPRTKLEEAMVQSWSALLHIEGIGVYDNFFELGGDSLQATILLHRLQEQLGEAVPGHVLFQVQSINDLADYLRRHCPDAVRRRYPEEIVVPSGELAAGAAAPASPGQEPAAGGNGVAGGLVSIPRLARDQQADELLARLDDLADDEVELLLGKTMTESEVDYE
jgi:acyl carrier protein